MASGVAVVPLASLLREPLQNGIFKSPSRAGSGTRLVNVVDLYADTVVDINSVDRLQTNQEELERYAVAAGDIFFTRSSLKPEGVGWTAYVENIDEQAVFECHLIRARLDTSAALPGFVSNYARSELARRYLTARASVTTMATVDQPTIESLPIVLPSIEEQTRLLSGINGARALRRAKLAAADALLAGMDGFVLATLGLAPPAWVKRGAFGVNLSAVRAQAHLNADYFHPERISTLRALAAATGGVAASPLRAAVAFVRDKRGTAGPNYLGLAHVESHTGELVAADEQAKGACYTFEAGDVLFARLRPYLNKVHCAESDGCCSTEFHVLRVLDRRNLVPDYLAAVLRSSLTLAQTRHMMTGNTHPRLTDDDVVDLRIPIPKDLLVQQSIAAEARRRREEARRLRAEAEADWQAAKRWFEEQLLGPTRA